MLEELFLELPELPLLLVHLLEEVQMLHLIAHSCLNPYRLL
jgi:hypothetical protein